MRLRSGLACLTATLLFNAASVNPAPAADKPVRMAYCVAVFNLFAAPFAVIKKLGYDKAEGIDLQMVNVKSGGDCATFLVTKEIPYANVGIEAVAGMVVKGAKLKTFYNHYQGTTLEIAVPENSPVRKLEDLRGKKIGIRDFTGLGTIVGKGMIRGAGMDPDKDVKFVAVGPTNVAARFLQDGTVDAISIGNSEHAQIGVTVGPKLRAVEAPAIERAPAIGLVTREDYYNENKKEAEAIARMYTKASIFMTRNAEAAVEILYETWPATAPQNKERSEAVKDDAFIVRTRLNTWVPELSGRKNWGELLTDKADLYLKSIAEWGIIAKAIPSSDFMTNEVIAAANNFDKTAIEKQADSYPRTTK
jgi:NitT/TauT family transport system substrate-binding protein